MAKKRCVFGGIALSSRCVPGWASSEWPGAGSAAGAGAGAPLARATPVGPTEAGFTAEASTAGFAARSGMANVAGLFTTIAAPGAAGAVLRTFASSAPSASCGGT